MSIDTIYESSMRKLSKAKSVGEMQRIVSEFNQECDEYVKQINDDSAKFEARINAEVARQEREFEALMEARRAEREALDKEIETVLRTVA